MVVDVFHVCCLGKIKVINSVSIGGKAKSVVGDEVHFISVATAGVPASISASISAVTTATVFGVAVDVKVKHVSAFSVVVCHVNADVPLVVEIPSVAIVIYVTAREHVSCADKSGAVCVVFRLGVAEGVEVDAVFTLDSVFFNVIFVV